MEVDPRFKAARAQAVKRRRRNIALPLLLWGGGALLFLGVPLTLYLTGVLTFGTPTAEAPAPEDSPAETAAIVAYSSPFVDVAGDPMFLFFDRTAGAENSKVLLRPPMVPPTRTGTDLILIRDQMITSQDRLITTLPSSREDFAFFQAQRQAPAVNPTPASAPAPERREEVVTVDEGGGSWGASLDGAENTDPVQFVRTRIENTTSLAYLRHEHQRQKSYEDVFLRLRGPRSLIDILGENGFEPGASARFAAAAIARLPELDQLAEGHILALRGAWLGGAAPEPVQLSAYTRDSYVGSVALSDRGDVVSSADPWVGEDLFSFAETPVADPNATGLKYRLLDAFYSAAMRNGVPSGVVGETIVLMSQSLDLESFARPGDEMVLLYGRAPGSEGTGPGQVLYAAIEGPGRRLECIVYRQATAPDYRCYGQGGSAGSGGGVSLRAGMRTPVQGVLTSPFGPREHPILKTVKLHQGVDWAAPTGTPVTAAFDGTIAAAGDGGGYGNLVKIGHPDGTETRYAHLDSFSELARPGQRVRAGDVIGFVGTTGLSTGPHLHFELHENGRSVDPFSGGGGLTGGSAVEQLTDRIIRVESGGKADAKNPLSSATGLGQFIDSTWIRMMRTYRPDLAAAMDRTALLALRTDPTISREMVQNLARESESYLSARGHQVTAGRLYLAHFLGAEGAHLVLSSPDETDLLTALGAGVINANPFLKGRDVAYIKSWADRKMRGAGGRSAPPPLPGEVRAFQTVIRQLLQS